MLGKSHDEIMDRVSLRHFFSSCLVSFIGLGLVLLRLNCMQRSQDRTLFALALFSDFTSTSVTRFILEFCSIVNVDLKNYLRHLLSTDTVEDRILTTLTSLLEALMTRLILELVTWLHVIES